MLNQTKISVIVNAFLHPYSDGGFFIMYEIYFHSFITGLLSMLIGAGVGTASYYGVLHSLLPSFLLGWVIGGACHLVHSRYQDGFTI